MVTSAVLLVQRTFSMVPKPQNSRLRTLYCHIGNIVKRRIYGWPPAVCAVLVSADPTRTASLYLFLSLPPHVEKQRIDQVITVVEWVEAGLAGGGGGEGGEVSTESRMDAVPEVSLFLPVPAPSTRTSLHTDTLLDTGYFWIHLVISADQTMEALNEWDVCLTHKRVGTKISLCYQQVSMMPERRFQALLIPEMFYHNQ